MAERSHISLLELQGLIKSRLDEALPLPYWVTAEISEVKVNYSGHCYLELVEKGGANQVPRARVSAVIWRGTYGALASYFASTTGRELEVGMQVLFRASVSYHELYGLSLVISDIDPAYTLGDMERQRQQTIARLQQEGVYDMNRELGFGPVVQRVAVVSSRNAAGYQDFMNEISASPYRFEVTLFDAFMQGNEAQESIICALEQAAERMADFDAVVMIRGGGSQSDLGAFDSYRLCSHVAQFPLPVITGIGHDKDRSVADMVAAVSLKTPTAAAAWLVEGVAEFDAWLGEAYAGVRQRSADRLDEEGRRVTAAAFALSRNASGLSQRLEIKLERLSSEIRRRVQAAVTRRTGALESFTSALRSRTEALVAREGSRLEMAERITRGRTPERILALGYAIVRRNGAAVKDGAALKPSDRIDITFHKGGAVADIKTVEDGEK